MLGNLLFVNKYNWLQSTPWTPTSFSMADNTSSSAGASDRLTDAERYIAGTATVMIAIAALLGNGLVFCAFIRFKKLRRPTNYFIVNLAVYDFLVGCLPVPFWASYLFTGKPTRKQGEFDLIYWLWECFDVMCALGSIASLAFIAVDRYICIKDALRYHALITTKVFYYCLAFVWAYSLIPVVLSYVKSTQLIDGAIFRYYIFIAGLIVPTFVMAFCYMNIYLVTIRLNREMHQNQQLGTFAAPFEGTSNCSYENTELELQRSDTNNQNSLNPGHLTNIPNSPMDRSENRTGGSHNQKGFLETGLQETVTRSRTSSIVQLTQENTKKSSLYNITGWGSQDQDMTQRNQNDQDAVSNPIERHNDHKSMVKAAKTLSFFMGAFLLTWTPFIMTIMLVVWKSSLITYRWVAFAKCLHYANSGLNPFLYSLLNVNFRKAFISILFCKPNVHLLVV